MNKELAEAEAIHTREAVRKGSVQRYKVTIGGESYFLVSDEHEEHVRAVAKLVDAQMQAIAQLGGDDSKRVAVLVALQCASKMVAATELIEKYTAHNEKLLRLITDEVSHFTVL
jgi:cell division protein ZapA (FtsZ GTPase activity inhibitor)